MLDKLRDEIVESQKTRTDLIKWKLILLAAIGAAAFGIGSSVPKGVNPPVVLLSLIPLVCLYVDAVCIHNEIRILMIARFIRRGHVGTEAKTYEDYCRDNRSWWFSIEEFALLLTTVGPAALIALAGWSDGLKGLMTLPQDVPPTVAGLLLWSGVAGLVFGAGSHILYFWQSKKLHLT